MLQDLIQLAFNSAQTRLSEISEERMRKEVPLPPGMKLPVLISLTRSER